MKAVNLLPQGTRSRMGGGISLGDLGPVHFVLGALVVVLAYVTVYVLTNNTISQRKSQIAALHQQLDQEQAVIARFNAYRQFEKLAQARDDTVRQIASSRFDWHGALTDLSKVMPANASLASLLATAAPGASVSGAGGSTAGSGLSTSGLRGAINAPAFELKGCTATQDDVARLISRMRLINGVQRVTLEDSTKSSGPVGGASAGSTVASGAAGGSGSCPPGGPGFDMVVFFQPLASAPPVAGAAPAASGTAPASGATATTPQTSATTSQVSNPSTSTGATK